MRYTTALEEVEQVREVEETLFPEKTVILSLTVGCPSARRKGDVNKIETTAERGALHLSKTIFQCAEWKALNTGTRKIGDYCRRIAVPAPIVKPGMHALPLGLVQPTLEKIKELWKEVQPLIDAFLLIYPSMIEKDRQTLGEQFEISNYPTPEQVRSSFYLEYNLVMFSTPTTLASGISEAFFEQEKEKMESMWLDAREYAFAALRSQFQKLVAHMVDRLGIDTDGKRQGKQKIFRDTMVDNFAEFLDTFGARNINNDGDLQRFVEQSKNLLKGVDPGDLRDNEALRINVANGFNKMKKQLDNMIVTKPKRRIVFDDSEV